MAKNTEQSGNDDRAMRIRLVLEDCLRRRVEGKSITDEMLIEEHPDLMPELSAELGKLRLIEAARRQAEDSGDCETGAVTRDFKSEDLTGLHIHCPNCHNPVNIAIDTPMVSINCTFCGNPFRIAGDDPETDQATLLKSLGHFELIEQIGSGGFGTVFKARDTELDRIVAVKIPRRGRLEADEIDQFLREARIAAQLKHPNIARIHEVGREDAVVYIICDFVNGVPLSDWMARRLTNREAAELCEKIARTLHYAHENGVIHRDLKPANILIDVNGEPCILDFGLAKREAGEVTVTLDGQVMGTPAYMSPEQARGDAHRSDRRSDIYSLGVIFFEMLTGELPFRGNERMLIYKVINDEPPSPSKFSTGIPRDLDTICLKSLEKDPDHRYGSARDFADDLGRWLAGEPITARPIGKTEQVWRWCRKNPRVPWFSLTLAVVMIIIYVVGAYQFRTHLIGLRNRLADTGIKSASFAARFAATEASRVLEGHFAAVKGAAADPNLSNSIRDICTDTHCADLLKKLRNTGPTSDEFRSQFITNAKDSRLQEWVTNRYLHDKGEGVRLFSWFVVGPNGVQLAREPQSEPGLPVPIGECFGWRAYIRDIDVDMDPNDYPPLRPGDLIKDIQFSPVFRTTVTDEWVAAISAPVKDEHGESIGVVGLMIRLGDFVTLEKVGEDSSRFPVLFDTRKSKEGVEGVIVDHPMFDQFPERIPNRFQEERFCVPFNAPGDQKEYQDPMGKDKNGQRYEGRWLRSEMVPIEIEHNPCGLQLFVQQSYGEMVDTPVRELRKGVLILSLSALGMVVAFLVPLWALVLRMLK